MSRRVLNKVLVLATALAALLAAAAPARAQSLEIEAGSPLTIEKLVVLADVTEGVALVDVDQTFRNGTGHVRQGVYRFRLPERAVVHSFSMWIDGREKRGRVIEAAAARAAYEQKVADGEEPGLLEEIGWRRFQVSVYPIPAGDTVRVRLVYAHVVDDDLGLRTLEIPLPAGTPVGVVDVTVRVHDAQGVSVLDCPSHAAAKVLHDDVLGAVRWSAEGVAPKGPFLVRTAPAVRGLGLACLAARPEGSAEGTFLVRVVPRLDELPVLPRDVVFVVDRSASMKGRKLEQARAALLHGLATLGKGDRFSIVSFSSKVEQLGHLRDGGLVAADEDGFVRARRFADGLTASGSTNIDAALQTAVSLRSDDPGRLFVVAFLTDGNPTIGEKDPDRIVARYRKKSAGKARLFAFGVGDDVEGFLLTRLAIESRGAAEYVRESEDLEMKLSALFDKVASPILTDVDIRVEGTDVHVLGTEPRRMPDVFRGTAVVMAGRYTGSGPVSVHLTGRVGTTPVDVKLPVRLPAATPDRAHVAQLWARMRIDRLLDELRVRGMVRSVREEIVRLALRYQVVTPYTSFLVVEDGLHIPDESELERVPDGPGGATASGGEPGVGGSADGASGTPGGSSSQNATNRSSGENSSGSREASDPPPAPEAGGPATPGSGAEGPSDGNGAAAPAGGSHGGNGGYRGPAGESPPPEGREASEPGGAPAGGGEVGGGGDGDGGDSGNGGAQAGGSAPSAGGPGAASGGAGRPSGSTAKRDFSWWRHWWQFHGDALVGADERGAPPLAGDVRAEVVRPALRARALDAYEYAFVRSEAQRALVRLGDEGEHVTGLAERMLAARPADGEPEYHPFCEDRSTRLMLRDGRLTGPARARLLTVLGDPGRWLGSVRPFAAISLGLGGADASGDAVAALLVAAREDGMEAEMLRPAALFSLGLLRDESAAPELVAALDSRRLGHIKLSDVELAYVVDALGRIGDPEAGSATRGSALVKRLIAVLREKPKKGQTAVVKRAVPAALARLAPRATRGDQMKIVTALRETARRARDRSTGGFALIALGRIAASPDVTDTPRDDAVEGLEQTWKRAANSFGGFTALALGLASGGPARARSLKLLRPGLASPDFEVQAASAFALAVAADVESIPSLSGLARDRGAMPDVRKAALFALAQVADTSVADSLREVLDDETDDATRTAILRSMAELGDRAALERLVALAEAGSEDAGVFGTIGRVGGADAALALANIASDPARRHARLVRGLAARALGAMTGAPDPRHRIAEDFPYRAFSAPLWEYMDWH